MADTTAASAALAALQQALSAPNPDVDALKQEFYALRQSVSDLVGQNHQIATLAQTAHTLADQQAAALAAVQDVVAKLKSALAPFGSSWHSTADPLQRRRCPPEDWDTVPCPPAIPTFDEV